MIQGLPLLLAGGAAFYLLAGKKKDEKSGPYISGPLRRDPPPAAAIKVGDKLGQGDLIVARVVDSYRGFAYGTFEVISGFEMSGTQFNPGSFVYAVQANQKNEPHQEVRFSFNTEKDASSAAKKFIDEYYDELFLLSGKAQ